MQVQAKEYKADQEQAMHMPDEIERMNLERKKQEAVEAALAAREADIAAAEASPAERQVAHEAEVAAKMKALEDQRGTGAGRSRCPKSPCRKGNGA